MSSIRLSEVCQIVMGQAPPGASYNDLGQGLPLLAGAGDFGELHPQPKRFTTSSAHSSTIGDILLCVRATVGECNWSDREYCLGRGVAALRPDTKKLDLAYLWHWLASNRAKLEGRARGSTFKQVTREAIASLPMDLPSLVEQRRIAELLDRADAVRRKREESLRLVDELLRSVFLEMFGDPVRNERGWAVKPLQELILADRPITYGILKPGPDIPGGIPYVRVVDMKHEAIKLPSIRRTTPEIAYAYRRSTLMEGDLLMSIRGHVGRLVIVPKELAGANITQDTARLAIVPNLDCEYVLACLSSESTQRWMGEYTRGMAVTGINLGDVKKLPVPLPPLDQQRRYGRLVAQARAVRKRLREASAANLLLSASLQSEIHGQGRRP